jgi:hypothetical protein
LKESSRDLRGYLRRIARKVPLGAFVIAELDDSPPVVCLETAAEGETLEDSATVAIVMLTFDNLRSKALPDEASREVIMKVAEERWI